MTYTVAENTGAARTGFITIAGKTFTVSQDGAAGAACKLRLIPDKIQKLFVAQADTASKAGKYRQLLKAGVRDDAGNSDVPAFFLKLFQYAGPFQGLIIIGEEGSGFTRADRQQWSSEAIETMLNLKLGKRILLAMIFINPFTAEEGDYDVTVGDCTGTLTIEKL